MRARNTVRKIVKKAIWLLTFSLLVTFIFIQFFELNYFGVSASDSSYQLMIVDTDDFFVPDSPDINISTVEIDDNETHVYFRLNVTGSVNTTHWYGIDLDYNQDEVEDHTLELYNGKFYWDFPTLINGSFSESSIVWVVPKSIEYDSNFTIQAFAHVTEPWSSDYAPADGIEWSSPYVWQIGVGIVEPYLTGVYSDFGLDLDEDGKFEYLAIKVEFNATIAGEYSVTIDGLTNTTHQISVRNTTNAGYLTEGIHNVTVLLPGTNIFSSRISGPYTLMSVVLECPPYGDAESNPYTTAFYDYRQFVVPPAYFTDTYSDAGVDLDGDGLFEYLKFTIGVNVTVGGTYTVGITNLLDSFGYTIYVQNSTTSDLEPGVQNVRVLILGREISSSGADGPYTISYLYLEDSAFNMLDTRDAPYTTGAYSYTDFEARPRITNDILEVAVEDFLGGEGIGVFTIGTGPDHPNPGEDVFYGHPNPWSTYTTIKVDDTLREYVTTTSWCSTPSSYDLEHLDDYSPSVDIDGTVVTITWTTLESLVVTQVIEIIGTSISDTLVRVTVNVLNNDEVSHTVGIRYEWDIMIDGEDGSYLRPWTDIDTPQTWMDVETEWTLPDFQFWETTNNVTDPVFYIYGSITSPMATPPPTKPDKFVLAYWPSCNNYAYDYTPTSQTVGGTDSAVLYYWNPVDLNPGSSREVTSYVTTFREAIELGSPVASFTYSPTEPMPAKTVTFDASSSYDPDGQILSYEWDFGDGLVTVENDPIVEHTYASAGTYQVKLTVTDNDELTGTTVKSIVVKADTTKPIAKAGIDQTVVEGTVVNFDAEGSSDNVGIVSYEWDFGDGTTGTGLTVNHTYAEPGTYIVTLTVRDATGNENTHSITITVLSVEDIGDEDIREPRSVYLIAEVAAVGAAVTAATAALASFGGLGQSFNSAVSRLPIPEKLKDFLQLYGEKVFETVDKAKLEALEKAPFITKGDLAALGISALIITIVFGFVETNGLPRFLELSVLAAVIPSTLLSVCMVSVAEELSEALCARTCRVYRQYRLWMYGLGAFLISGLLFLFPFASPGITRYQSGEISNKTKGLIVLSKMLVLLTLTIPFAGLFMFGFRIIGDAGLLLTLMIVCYSLVPIKPLAGKAVFDYRKEVSVIAFVSAGILFYSCIVNLLPHVTYLAVGVVSVFLAVITLSQLRKEHPK